jgi:uncharacterized membrane protein YhaH (DUF805 family)
MAVGQYIGVFFNPNGRLPRDLYWFYGLPIVIAIFVTRASISGAVRHDDKPELWLLGVLSLLIWMHACVMSRRLRDCGVMLVVDASTVFFPDLLGDTDDIKVQSVLVITAMLTIFQWLFKLVCAACLLKEGDSGTNVYGDPLGTLSGKDKAMHEAKRRSRMEEDVAVIVTSRQQKKASLNAAVMAESFETPAPRLQTTIRASAFAEGDQAPSHRAARQGFGRR